MRVKTFEAASMQEALNVVKREMGEEAFILSTRSKSRRTAQGLEETVIEVTAAVDELPASAGAATPTPAHAAHTAPAPSSPAAGTYGLRPPLAPAPAHMPERLEAAPILAAPDRVELAPDLLTRAEHRSRAPRVAPERVAPERVAPERVAPERVAQAPAPPPPPPVDLQPLRRELLEIKGAVEALREQENRNSTILKELDHLKALLSRIQKQGMPPAQLQLPPSLLELYGSLVSNDVDPILAMRLCEYAQRALLDSGDGESVDPEKARLFLHRVIMNFIPVASPIQLDPAQTRVAALVGPTGVGKTTTIAKLAAYAKLNLKQKVALLTLDTFRMAAVDQLQQYAQILQVPIHVALTVEDLRSALRFYQDRALVLIDTPGHNPKDGALMGQMKRFLEELPSVETHLVLSATTKPKDLSDIAQRFEPLKPSRLIFTKLDETSTYGPILSTLVRVKRPLSYLGTGQEVPEDLELATSRRVADLIVPVAQVLA